MISSMILVVYKCMLYTYMHVYIYIWYMYPIYQRLWLCVSARYSNWDIDTQSVSNWRLRLALSSCRKPVMKWISMQDMSVVRSNKPPTPYSNHLVPGWQVQASDGKKIGSNHLGGKIWNVSMVKDESNSQNRYYTVSLLVVRNLYISQITITTKYHKSIQKHTLQKHDVAEMGSQNCYLYSIDTPYPPQPFTPFSPIPSDSLHQFVTELQPQRVQRVFRRD